jgi:hypothetical protein
MMRLSVVSDLGGWMDIGMATKGHSENQNAHTVMLCKHSSFPLAHPTVMLFSVAEPPFGLV